MIETFIFVNYFFLKQDRSFTFEDFQDSMWGISHAAQVREHNGEYFLSKKV